MLKPGIMYTLPQLVTMNLVAYVTKTAITCSAVRFKWGEMLFIKNTMVFNSIKVMSYNIYWQKLHKTIPILN